MSDINPPIQPPRFRESTRACTGCSEQITFRESTDGNTVEVLHPQPPCAGFRSFCARLVARHKSTLSGEVRDAAARHKEFGCTCGSCWLCRCAEAVRNEG